MAVFQNDHRTVRTIACWMLAVAAFTPAFAQDPQYHRIGHTGCQPISQRTGELGCWITAEASQGKLPPQPIYWHLDQYPTRAAAETERGPHGTVVESLSKIWLFAIATAEWHPSGGRRVASIGPLPVRSDAEYTAVYMEAIFTPGMTSSVHRHSGPEAWYTLSGETCLETSEGRQVGRAAGDHVIVPGGLPMYLTATGSENRRALVLILHDSSQPASSQAPDWTPKGLCK